jgi:hypothetical protein
MQIEIVNYYKNNSKSGNKYASYSDYRSTFLRLWHFSNPKTKKACKQLIYIKKYSTIHKLEKLVGTIGLEPTTPTMSR